MGGLGTSELIVIAVVALILFGPSKIPDFARSLGRAVNQFKKGLNEGLEEDPHAKKKDERPK
ncbi:MAG: twin-arginine translocase TatA/TatE family subunit [Elusimicrobia bacterium]|nr:twin-arginine translocase TatA/TatE family subunit [Elusimicrobiota bacterium]